jgi:hypothetical protein
LSLTRTPSLIRLWRKEDNYEVEEVKEEDRATREASAGGLTKAGQAETQIAGIGVSKGLKSCKKIGCPRYWANREEVSRANSRNEETEEKIESFTGTPCATCCRDESKVGCEASCPGE